MKKTWIILALTIIAGLYLLGCSSPQQKAQKLFSAGQYEQVVTQFGSDPSCAGLVADSKEKLAEKMMADGKYAAVVEMYPDTKAAQEAKNKLAEQLFADGKFQDVISMYPNSPAAGRARAEIMRMQQEEQAKMDAGQKGKKPAPAAQSPSKEANMKADAELQKIMKIKLKDLRMKALKEFVAKPEFKGTPAVKKAQLELSK